MLAKGNPIALLGLLGVMSGCGLQDWGELPGPITGHIDGRVIGSEPIRGATVEVWTVDEMGARSEQPRYMGRSDDAGRFEIAIDLLVPPFVVTARGGTTTEYWSAEDIVLDDRVHVQTVITRKSSIEPQSMVLSPFTTIAEALARQWLMLGQEATYSAAVARAHGLLDDHFHANLRHTFPARPAASVLTEEVRHGLALAGLSAIVHDFADRSGRDIQAMNILMLTDALVADVQADARLDGMGTAGVITLDRCMPACALSANTLRSDLVRALLRDYVPSEYNGAGLDFGDAAEFFYGLAENQEPALFGTEPTATIDGSPPAIEMLPSLILDESRDVIAFDAALQPFHVHDTAATIDLAAQLGGACPVVHKHTNLLGSADDNPLRWRFAVRDDVVGFRGDDVKVRIQPLEAPGTSAIPLTPVAVQSLAGGGTEYEAAVTREQVLALADTEGTFEIEIQARDWVGNEAAPLTACWMHVPRAAPQWVGAPEDVTGAGSFADTTLDNDEIAALLGGNVPPAQGKPLLRFDVMNGTDEAVFLTLDVEALEGTYERTWIEARAFVRGDSIQDACLSDTPPSCSQTKPREPRVEDYSGVQPLPLPGEPGFFLALRVLDKASQFEDSCEECDPGEVRLAPRRRYEVQVVATTLGFLLPPDFEPAQVARIKPGPVGSAPQLTGIIDEPEYVRCAKPNFGDPALCDEHEYFQLYQALTHARIDISALRIRGQTAPTASLVPRTPRPSTNAEDGTLAAPVTASYAWSTQENALPPEDAN